MLFLVWVGWLLFVFGGYGGDWWWCLGFRFVSFLVGWVLFVFILVVVVCLGWFVCLLGGCFLCGLVFIAVVFPSPLTVYEQEWLKAQTRPHCRPLDQKVTCTYQKFLLKAVLEKINEVSVLPQIKPQKSLLSSRFQTGCIS